MNLTTIIQPPYEPVTLLEVYSHLRLSPEHAGSPGEETHPDDTMLAAYIKAAREHVEQMARRSLVQQTLRMSMATFPVSVCQSAWFHYYTTPRKFAAVERIRLFRPPVLRVESVRYFDGDNVLQTVDPGSYYITDEQVPELRFVTSFSSPTTYDRPDAVRVDYVTGYTPNESPAATQEDYAANIPQALKEAVLLGVQLLYDALAPADREAIERTREALVQPYRIQHV